MTGDIFVCHNLGGRGYLGIEWVGARDAAQHSTVHTMPPFPTPAGITAQMPGVPGWDPAGGEKRWDK